MNVQQATDFFMWCVIINTALFVLWAVFFMAVPNLVYRTQQHFFPVSKDQFNLIFYGFLGLYKIFLLVFAVVPYLALLIIG